MNLFEFCADLPNINKHIVYFRADVYSALFFSLLMPIVKKKLAANAITLQTIDIENYSLDDIKRVMSVSFLGQNYFYWLKDLSNEGQLSSKLQTYFSKYNGPHVVLFFAKKGFLKENSEITYVDLPESIDAQTYQKLIELFFPEHNLEQSFLAKFFQSYPQITLEQACLIMQYQMALGKRFEKFLAEWTDKIISPDYSLFTLSQYLFAQEYQLFFAHLEKLKKEFADEFWIVFWSEQLWQAIVYTSKASQVGPVEAKKFVNRLPFSFMNKDWKKFPIVFLVKAHQELYQIDYACKNGNNDYALELWYHKFFLRKF